MAKKPFILKDGELILKRTLLICIGILLFSSILATSVLAPEKSNVIYTPSTTTWTLEDGRKNVVYWSGIRNVYEDGKYKPREKAKSFKEDSNINCNVIFDGYNVAECSEYNETSRTIKFSVTESRWNMFWENPLSASFETPLKKYHLEYNTSTKESKRVYDKEFEKNISFQWYNTKKEYTIKASAGEVLEFGEHSTTIILQDANNETLEDAGYEQGSPNANNGNAEAIAMGKEGANYFEYIIKVNINTTMIPTGQQVDAASLHVYIYEWTASATGYISVYGVTNQSWWEGTGASDGSQLCYNNQIPQATIDSSSDLDRINRTLPQGNFFNLNVTTFVSSEYIAGHLNVSFLINATNSTTPARPTLYTKDYTVDAAKRPYLNVTYSAAPNIAPIVAIQTITPAIATYLSTLNCSTYAYDANLDTMSVNFTWYNGSTYYEDNVVSGVTNGTLASDTLTAQTQYDNETWNCTVFANDATDDSEWNSTNISIESRPTHTTPFLNSTNQSLNGTYQNLTCWNQSTADIDGDYVKNIYNWYQDSTSIMLLNMPFEANGSEATYANDYSGYNYTGIVNGTTFNSTAGYDNRGAYEFDGDEDYLMLGDNMDGGTGDLSLIAWINTSTSGTSQFIVGKRDVDTATNKGYEMHVSTLDNIICTISDGQRVFIISSSTVTDGNWHHIGCTLDRDGNGQVYIDGVADGNVEDITNTSEDIGNSNDFLIGAMANDIAPKYFFNGTIDEVKVYNRALSPEQVNALYHNNTHIIVSNETDEGDSWKCAITPNDDLLDGNRLESNSLVIQTINPTVSNIVIDPTSAYTNSTVNGTFIVTDINDATVTAYCDWFNGTALYSSHSKSISVNTLSNFSLDPSAIQYKGETWNFTCNATDNSGWSAFNSTTITILNAPPSLPTIGDPANESRSIANSVTLNCDSSTDIDGDEIKYEIFGDLNNPPTTLLQNTTTATYDLATIDGGVYWWRCKAGDNENASVFTQIKQFTENNLSIVANVTILPLISYTNTTLTGYSVVSDSEDTLTVYMNWTNGTTHYSSCIETSVASGSTESCALTAGVQAEGETWNFTSQIWDGYELSEFNSTTITILNTVPTIDTPTLAPANVYTNTTLFNCSTIAYDVDLDSLIINFTWWNGTLAFNSTSITTTNGTTESYPLNPSLAQHSKETWNCSVRVYDGTNYSNIPSTTKTISNTAPTVPDILPAYNTTTVASSQTLTCSGSTDIDDDEIKIEFWGGNSPTSFSLLQNSTLTTYSWSLSNPNHYYFRCLAYDNETNLGYTATTLLTRAELDVNCSGANATATPTLNFTFASENGTRLYDVDFAGSFTYWGTDSLVSKTEANDEVVNDEILYCISPKNESIIETDALINYEKTGWSLRSFSFNNHSLLIERQDIILYLLPTAEGIYVTFQVVSVANNPLNDVFFVANRTISGSSQTIYSALTDAAGTVTPFLDPDYPHTFVFSKEGYITYTATLSPTQTSYTITLESEIAVVNETSYSRGIAYTILPANDTLENNTIYNFSFNVSSSYHDIESAGFNLTNSTGDQVASASCTGTASCISSTNYNVLNNTLITMNYYWIINGIQSGGKRTWYVYPTYEGGYSIMKVFEDAEKLGAGFGDFTKSIISFLIIISIVGVACLKFELHTYSEAAVLGLITFLVMGLDFVGFLPSIPRSVPHFIPIAMGLITIGYIIYEFKR